MNELPTNIEQIRAGYSNEFVLRELRKFEALYGLRKVRRWGVDDHTLVLIESVSEHVFNTGVVADFFYAMGGLPVDINMQRVHELIRYHDLSEIISGDKVQTMKTDRDEIANETHLHMIERKLPRALAPFILTAIREFDAQETLEARAAWALEKTEPAVEILVHGIDRLVGPESRCIPDDETAWHGWTPHARRKAAAEFPIISHFGEVIHEEIMRQLEAHRPDWAEE